MVLQFIFFFLKFSILKVENELVDLIDELLERDAGTVNSTIIGKPLDLSMRAMKRKKFESKCKTFLV